MKVGVQYAVAGGHGVATALSLSVSLREFSCLHHVQLSFMRST